MRRYFLLIIVCHFLSHYSIAQESNVELKNNYSSRQDSGKITLSIDNLNAFINKEYFHPVVKGYTIPGSTIEGKLKYHFNERTKFEIGANYLMYYGLDSLMKPKPILKLQYQFVDEISFGMGALNQSTLKSYPDAFYNKDLLFTNNVLNGFQFLFHYKYWEADVLLNWEQFIFHGDDKQEEFMALIHNKFNLFPENDLISFKIIASILGKHKGGQIDINDDPVYTALNTLFGLELFYSLNDQFQIGTKSYLSNYSNNKSGIYLFDQGIAYKPGLFIGYGDLSILTSCWLGQEYIAIKGNPYYNSFQRTNKKFDNRILSVKVDYSKQLNKSLFIGVEFDLYKPESSEKFDYMYSLYFRFKEGFKIK